MQETTPQTKQNEEPIHHAGDKSFKIMMKKKASALELNEKNLSRSLFLAYTFTEKKERITKNTA